MGGCCTHLKASLICLIPVLGQRLGSTEDCLHESLPMASLYGWASLQCGGLGLIEHLT